MRQEKEAYGNDLEMVQYIRMVEEERKAVKERGQAEQPSDSGKVGHTPISTLPTAPLCRLAYPPSSGRTASATVTKATISKNQSR